MYKKIFLWVEGPDDVKFFESVIKPLFEREYNFVKVIPYGCIRTDKIVNYLKSIRAMGDDYIFVADIDTYPCITAKKETVRARLTVTDKDQIAVIVKEIESWYLAGLDSAGVKQFRTRSYRSTDNVSKEQFNALFGDVMGKLGSRVYLLSKLLEHFSKEVAKEQNRSFGYFLRKHVGIV